MAEEEYDSSTLKYSQALHSSTYNALHLTILCTTLQEVAVEEYDSSTMLSSTLKHIVLKYTKNTPLKYTKALLSSTLNFSLKHWTQVN